MFKTLTIFLISFTMFACGGSSSQVDTADLATSVPISSDAVAMAVAASEAGGDVGHMSTVLDVTITPLVKSAIQLISNGIVTWKLTEQEVNAQDGTGTFIVNGASSLDADGKVSLLNANGDLDVQLKDITKAIDVNGSAYTTTINGKLKIIFSGTELPLDFKESQIYTDINYSITGSNLAVTGGVVGTIVDLNAVRNMKIVVVDGVAKRISVCSGTATIKTDEGTTTCTYQADCSKCS